MIAEITTPGGEEIKYISNSSSVSKLGVGCSAMKERVKDQQMIVAWKQQRQQECQAHGDDNKEDDGYDDDDDYYGSNRATTSL